MARPPTDAEFICLHEDIQQLTTAVQALALQREHDREDINVQPQPQEESDNEENLFCIIEQHEDWRQGFKFELPEYYGGQSPEELLDWIITVENTLEFKCVPLERCVPMVVMQFRGKATAWWTQLKASRARLGKPKILSWDKLKKKMRKMFLPFNYDQLMFQRLNNLRQGRRSVNDYSTEFFLLLSHVDLQDSEQKIVARFIGGLRQRFQHNLNLLNPLTIAEAHQKALTMEAQTKENVLWEAAELFALGLFVYLSIRPRW